MHARVIADIRTIIKTDGFIVDQFAKGDLVKNSLSELASVDIISKTKGENDTFVAAASILARYHFVKSIEMMSSQYNFNFPKGAGNHVKNAIEQFKEKIGEAQLKNVLKMHFKI
jgi:ribonuclease HIII